VRRYVRLHRRHGRRLPRVAAAPVRLAVCGAVGARLGLGVRRARQRAQHKLNNVTQRCGWIGGRSAGGQNFGRCVRPRTTQRVRLMFSALTRRRFTSQSK
jgi:hypothetical protein